MYLNLAPTPSPVPHREGVARAPPLARPRAGEGGQRRTDPCHRAAATRRDGGPSGGGCADLEVRERGTSVRPAASTSSSGALRSAAVLSLVWATSIC